MKQQLLLVGPEPSRWQTSPQFTGLLADRWALRTAPTAAAARALMAEQPADAVVAQFALPDSSGLQFLDALVTANPGAHRFLLADLANHASAFKCVGTAHGLLSAPCEPAMLASALERAAQINAWLHNDAARQILAQGKAVLSPPITYFQIAEELRSPNATLESVGAVIARDPAITSKVLQLANSAILGLKRQVASPAHAVMYLGLEPTKALVLLAHSYSHFDDLTAAGFSVDNLWRHSLATGRFSQLLAELQYAESDVIDQSFTAGLIHDLGKLLMASLQPEGYRQLNTLAREQRIHPWQAEQKVLGATHAEVGACLAATWNLPLPVIEALALHHEPGRSSNKAFSPLTAVHAANILEHEQQSARSGATPPKPDMTYLGTLRLDKRWNEWRTACRKVDGGR